MSANKRNLMIGFAVLFTLLVLGLFASGGSHIVIDGEEIGDVGGIAGILIAAVVAFVAIVLALSVTGLVLVGVALMLVVVLATVLGSFALAVLPLLFPFLIIYAIYCLFRTKKQVA